MLKDNHYTRRLSIHKNFPKALLVEIMRPFLYHKYMYKYGIHGLEKTELHKRIINVKLKKFYNYNKLFGRIRYNTNCLTTPISNAISTTFNTQHIKFHEIKIRLGDTDFREHGYHSTLIIDHPLPFYEPSDTDTEPDSDIDFDMNM
jgi:hypothetical protein